MTTATPPRRRLPPEERREQLLDCARDLVERDGVAACTVEAVSRSAGVTPQLVHKHLGTRTDLLQALFVREDGRYQQRMRAALAEATTFEDVVRVFVAGNFDQQSAQTAIGRLRDTPEVAPVLEERARREHRGAGRLLAKALSAEHELTPQTVEFVLRLGSAASIAAGDLAARRGSDRATQIDATVRFIMGGLRATAEAESSG